MLFILILFGYGTFKFFVDGQWGFALVTIPLMMMGGMGLVQLLRPAPKRRIPMREDVSIPPPIE